MAILGIDEVGRGPLAGPLVVGAVILPDELPDWAEELNDSKKLTFKKRAKLSEIILNEAVATGLGFVSPFELDELGMVPALKLASRRAIEEMSGSSMKCSKIIIDGNINFLSGTKLESITTTLIKGDALVKEISAASIIAKVARDNYMIELGVKYPGYGFEKHMGYGTKAHVDAIKTLGLTPEHRLSFEPCKSISGFKREEVKKNTTKIGNQAEEVTAKYLISNGHRIIARNFKTRYAEIDVISVKGDKILFTEVKYRKNADFGGGLAAITPEKVKKMEIGARVYLEYYPQYKKLQPVLAVANVSGDFVIKDWFTI